MSTEKPPSTLYHYTSQKGLLGIIEKGEIWATDILYLNDTMEYKYAVNLFSEKIEKFKKSIFNSTSFFFIINRIDGRTQENTPYSTNFPI
jgi:hypothetical protein